MVNDTCSKAFPKCWRWAAVLQRPVKRFKRSGFRSRAGFRWRCGPFQFTDGFHSSGKQRLCCSSMRVSHSMGQSAYCHCSAPFGWSKMVRQKRWAEDGWSIARFGSLLRHFLEHKFLSWPSFRWAEVLLCGQRGMLERLGKYSDETSWSQLGPAREEKCSETLIKNSLVLRTVIDVLNSFSFRYVEGGPWGKYRNQFVYICRQGWPLSDMKTELGTWHFRGQPVVLVFFDGTLNLIGYTLGCYFWMVSGRGYIPRLLCITV